MALTTQQKLDDAEKAYHDLLTGCALRVVVDRNGERVEFTGANRQMLKAYIDELRTALGLNPTSGGPLQFLF